MFSPSKTTSPEIFADFGNSPITASEDTLLPEPDSPTIANVSPLATS